MVVHVARLAVLDRRNGKKSVSPHGIQSRVDILVYQLKFCSRIKSIGGNSSEIRKIPSRVVDSAVANPAAHQRAQCQGGGEQRPVILIFCSSYMYGRSEGWLMKQAEDGVDGLKIEMYQVDDNGLAGNI